MTQAEQNFNENNVPNDAAVSDMNITPFKKKIIFHKTTYDKVRMVHCIY